MKLVKFLVFALLSLIPCVAHASAANIYVGNVATGNGSGSSCGNALGVSFLDSPSNWGAGSSQVGPGTIVHLCNAITRAGGSSGILTHGNGTALNPIEIFFETGAIIQAPYFGNVCQFTWSGDGTDIDDNCFSSGVCTLNCNAGIEIENDFIVVDGGTNGIIQSTNNGSAYSPQAVAGSGTAGGAQQPNQGVYVGPHQGIKVRNLKIQHIYDNSGTGQTADCYVDQHVGLPCDSGGVASWDISIAQGSTYVSVCNNYLYDARIAVTMNGQPVANNAVDPNCQSNTFVNGLNVFLNTTDKHAWQMSLTNNGDTHDETANIYANQYGSQTNWFGPMSAYHEDGIIMQPYGGVANIYVYLFNNWFSGDLTGSNTTAEIFVSAIGSGSDAILTGFNNLITAPNPTVNPPCCAVVFGGGSSTSSHAEQLYNNTFDVYDIDWWFYGAPNVPFLMKNNLHRLGNLNGEAGTIWYYIPDGPQNYAQFAGTDRNLYFLTPGGANFGQAWNITGAELQTLSSWQSASGLDANSVNADPLLDSTWHLSSASSPAIGLGANLTSLCSGGAPALAYLCYDKPATVGVGGSVQGFLRPSSGGWTNGVYNYISNTPAPTPAFCPQCFAFLEPINRR